MLSFPINEPVELSFKVNVIGSGSAPHRVTTILRQGAGAGLAFEASPRGEGAWSSTVTIPAGVFTEGPAQLCIEVLLKHKLFTPVRETVKIVGATAPEIARGSAGAPAPAATLTSAPAPAPAPAPAEAKAQSPTSPPVTEERKLATRVRGPAVGPAFYIKKTKVVTR